MGLEQVKSEIIKEAEKKAVKLVADSQVVGKSFKKEATEKLKDYEESVIAETKKEIIAMEKREEASQKLEAKKMLFEAKKELLQEVIEGARKKISSSSAKQKARIISKLLLKAKNEIHVSYIYCNKDDVKLLKGNGKVEAGDISGGMIAENKQKTVRIDYSVDTILDQIADKHLQDVAKILF